MVFNSFEFVFLLLVTFCLYYLPILKKYQLQTIIFSSFIFYAYHYPLLLSVLVLSIAINIIVSYLIVNGNQSYQRQYAITGVVFNLTILGFFKYSPLIGGSFFENTGIGDFLISIPLPIGISFFTFQGISLVVDTVKNKPKEEFSSLIVKNLVSHSFRVAMFISFFSQLVAGPILKAHEFLPQIKEKHFKEIDWDNSFKAMTTGYFLKMVIADNLKDYTFGIAYPFFERYSSLTLISMLYGYSIQIFADFAGYSLIAIGVARLFGYKLKDNFNFPYISSSFTEFWQRWHISLSSFLKEYLYIPLGGNRKSKLRTYVNLMATMVLGGIWHGAAWSYAVWGGFHGLLLAVERFLKNTFEIKETLILRCVKAFFVFSCVTFAWLLFKLPEFGHVVKYIIALKSNLFVPTNRELVTYIVLYSLPVILYHYIYLIESANGIARIATARPFTYGTMLFLIITNAGSSNAFIYFQF